MKCRRVDSTRFELHDSSLQKSTRLTGSQVARHLEIFCYLLERVRDEMSASRLHSTRVARFVTAKVDSSHLKSGRKTLKNISLYALRG